MFKPRELAFEVLGLGSKVQDTRPAGGSGSKRNSPSYTSNMESSRFSVDCSAMFE